MDRAQLVYQWTEHLYPHMRQVRLSFEDTQDVIRHAWTIYRTTKPPKLVLGRECRTNGDIIELPSHARTLPIILHEVAHSLILNADEDPHGEQFISALMSLYEAFLPAQELRSSAESFGLINPQP